MDLMEKIVSLCKRRGFVWQSSDIYGGFAGFWDYGHFGVILKENIKQAWLSSIVGKNADAFDIFLVDTPAVTQSDVLKASGHVQQFWDQMAECEKCKRRLRVDQEVEKVCPDCGGGLTEPRTFNMLFKTHVGAVEDKNSQAFLRPETAQGIFTNFKNVIDSFHPKLPFGIAQIGRSFRNEITPRNFLFRAREFEQMELEFFVDPKKATKWYKFWVKERLQWFLDLGINKKNIRAREYGKDELAHYADATTDLEYAFPFSAGGFGELEGIANRTDFDLSVHKRAAKHELVYREDDGATLTPYVIEPSLGIGRAVLAFLLDAYQEDGDRVILKLHPKLAPYTVAVFPLLANKEKLVKKAREVYKNLTLPASAWDDRGNIGKRYYSQDEIGTPWCVTVDFQTLEDETVTVRDRDSAKQERIAISELPAYFGEKLK